MPQLLSVPREVRDNMLSFAILGAKTPSVDVTDCTPRAQPKEVELGRWNVGDNVGLPTQAESHTPSSTALLLVNRQLYAEAKDVLRRHPLPRYTLDIMVVNEQLLWPTWTCIPTPGTRIDILAVTFRIVTPDLQMDPIPTFAESFMRFATLISDFYRVLERFFKLSPVGPSDNMSSIEDKKITIRMLELDVKTPTYKHTEAEASSLQFAAEDRQRHAHLPGENESIPEKRPKAFMQSKHLAAYISHSLSGALELEGRSADFGALLFERIGDIQMTIDGDQYQKWDLGRKFWLFPSDKVANIFWKGEHVDFNEWWLDVILSRVDAGFEGEK